MPDFKTIGRRLRPEAKAVAATFGTTWVDTGAGRMPWPALSQFDHARQIGPLADSSIVSIALGFIRRNITQGRFIAGVEAQGEYKESKGHPLIRMLRRPNPFDSWGATLGGTSDSIAIDGNSYWLKGRDGFDEVREVFWAPNHQMEVVPEIDPNLARANGPIRGYWFTSGGHRTWYAPRDVVHFRNGRDPLCRYMGVSDLKRQLRNIYSMAAVERYTAAVLRNAHAGKVLAPKADGVNILEDSPQEAELDGLARSLEHGLSGENVGRIRKLSLAVDILSTGLGPEEMALDRIGDRPEAYILASCGLNALALNLPGSKDTSTYANKGEARREAIENGVIPIQDLVSDEVDVQLLLPDFPDAEPLADCTWWDRKDVAALREDATERATRAVSLFTGDLTTKDESRALVDQKAVGPARDGDKFHSEIGMEQARAIAELRPEPGPGAEEEEIQE